MADEEKVKTKIKKPTASFASFNLSPLVLKAVERKGYKLATPIQRKCIPLIMSGRDTVAMARTGSGKSAAFLLPILDKLKARSMAKPGTRALIVSPTRELAMQTFKFAKEFGKYTTLVPKIIIGGESINHDFETIASSPDILIATPGRLAHVLVEMKKKLNSLEVVVFDEADRLFEPGFKELEQVNEICHRMPDSKQTLLFSATMPQKLIEFAKAGLKAPVFIRLDVECNLSDTLKSVHLHCNFDDKFAILLHLLKNFVKKEQMTVVFMPTRHHIEYALMLLERCRIDCTSVYSSLDPEARKINIAKFSKKKCNVMLVTDIAARGIDIPLLDIVINFNFPYKPKLYIHRVGRVARAGRFGCAIDLVSHDETQYLHELHTFFSMTLKISNHLPADSSSSKFGDLENLPHMILGSVPQQILDDENNILKLWHQHDDDLKAMVRVCSNAMKPYVNTRNLHETSNESVKVAKELHKKFINGHPIFGKTNLNNAREEVLAKLRAWKNPKYKDLAHEGLKKFSKLDTFADQEHFLKYNSALKEDGFALDLMGDDEKQLQSQNHMMWDRKKKKFVQPENTGPKKIKTESGALISASYSSGLFEKWKSQSKMDYRDHDNGKNTDEKKIDKLRRKLNPPTKRRKELKNYDEMLKDRNVKEKRERILKAKIHHKSLRKDRGKEKSNSKSSNKNKNKPRPTKNMGRDKNKAKSRRR